eukprot:9594072-Heterocapsa_arctica.AAC.1
MCYPGTTFFIEYLICLLILVISGHPCDVDRVFRLPFATGHRIQDVQLACPNRVVVEPKSPPGSARDPGGYRADFGPLAGRILCGH